MERTLNKSPHKKLTLENKILPPLLLRFELATFQTRVQHTNQRAIPAPFLNERESKTHFDVQHVRLIIESIVYSLCLPWAPEVQVNHPPRALLALPGTHTTTAFSPASSTCHTCSVLIGCWTCNTYSMRFLNMLYLYCLSGFWHLLSRFLNVLYLDLSPRFWTWAPVQSMFLGMSHLSSPCVWTCNTHSLQFSEHVITIQFRSLDTTSSVILSQNYSMAYLFSQISNIPFNVFPIQSRLLNV